MIMSMQMAASQFYLLIATNIFGIALAYPNFAVCDNLIALFAGQTIPLYSPSWPAGYLPGSSCRYQIVAPIDYQIQITCRIDMKDPSSGSCSSERLYIAVNGNKDISYAECFCGTQTITKASLGNVLTLAYTSSFHSGIFDCTLTTICDCGWGLNSRIVGGQETAPNEFPSTASLVSIQPVRVFCGATIVSSLFLITAAHCLRITAPDISAIEVGEHNIAEGSDTPFAAIYKILRFIEHPEYSIETGVNDIGLVQTILPIAWSRGVGPVCLPFFYSGADFSGANVIAAGWGSTSFGGPSSDFLQKVDLTILSNNDPLCMSIYPTIQNSQVCSFRYGKDTCQFDSGNGLYFSGPSGSRNFLVAQVSLGHGCAGNTPALNTRITSFISWIENYTGELCKRAIS